MNKIRIAVLVSGGGTNLQALIDAQASGSLQSGEIALVVSNKPGAYALERAKRAGIETLTLTRTDCGSQEGFETALMEALDSRKTTVHYVNEVPDGGKILLQKAVSVEPGDTPETLQRRVMEQAEWRILPEAAEMVSAKLLNDKENWI